MTRATFHFERAAKNGSPLAQHTMGCLLSQSILGPMDIPRAIEYFKMAAGQGVGDSMFNLGEIIFFVFFCFVLKHLCTEVFALGGNFLKR
jgi:TPR repeat protein